MEKTLCQTASKIGRIAFVGPECTGKTTLAKALAEHYQTLWVPEFMRTYLQKKWDEKKETCIWEDLIPIAKGQISSENELITKANQYLFCDTNLFELMVYSYIYYQKCPTFLEKYALKHQYDFIFLTNIDVPWQADDLRDKPNERKEIFSIFKSFLEKNNYSFTILEGDVETRIQKVISKINLWNN
ncbi:MAG: ATP-binding protein [Capnocytophaga sp.]|nr:ATP-binding protein [Capnocytophaga sp.]